MPLLIALILLISLPLAEIALFIWVGGMIGILPTLLLTIFAILLGAALLWTEGFATLKAARESLNRGEVPVEHVLSGAILTGAAFLLMTPGFITNALGFVLLIRPLRMAIGRALFARLVAGRLKGGRIISLKARRVDLD
jgi:UPF0716 protein FxsA